MRIDGRPRQTISSRAAAKRVIEPRPVRAQNLSVRYTFVSSFEVLYLPLCFFATNSIALLHLPDELIALFFDDLPIIVGQPTPFFLGLPDELFPASFDLVGVRCNLTQVRPALPTASRSFRFHGPTARARRSSLMNCYDDHHKIA